MMTTKQPTKKGVADLASIMTMGAMVAIGFVVFVVVLTLGGSLLSGMQTAAGGTGNANSIAGNGSEGLLQIASQSTNIGLVVGIVIILLILVGGLGFFLAHRQE